MTEKSVTLEIPVWVDGSEKWVTGVNKKTTCDDVIYALLCHVKRHRRDEEPDVRDYGLYEGWMGVERLIQGRARILKLWRQWGDNKQAVTFTVRRHEPITKPHKGQMGEASAVERVRRRRSHRKTRDKEQRTKSSQRPSAKPSEQDRSAKADKQSTTSEKSKVLHGYVTQILEQERILQQQSSRLSQIDKDIQHYENVVNQLAAQAEAEASDKLSSYKYLKDLDQSLVSLSEHDFDDFSTICDKILHMDEKISSKMSTAKNLTSQLLEESIISDSEYQQGHSSNPSLKLSGKSVDNQQMQSDLDTLQQQLKRSITLTLQQQQQLVVGEKMISDCNMDIQHKNVCISRMSDEYDQRVSEINTLEQQLFDLYGSDAPLPHGYEPDMGKLQQEQNIDNCDVAETLDTDRVSSDCPKRPPKSRSNMSDDASSTTTNPSNSDTMSIDAGYVSHSTTNGEPSPDIPPCEKQESPWNNEPPIPPPKPKFHKPLLPPGVDSVINGVISNNKSRFYDANSNTNRTMTGVPLTTLHDGGAISVSGVSYEYDSNSDTGMSSLHSSDECSTGLVTLV